MKPSEIISLARRQTGCTEDIVTTDEAYKFLNFVIEDFGADIRNSDSGYGFDILQIPVIAGQTAYTFESDEELGTLSENFPIHKIQAVWLFDTRTGKYRDLPVHFVDKVDINKYENQGEPKVCFITRTELNLIPMPKENSHLQVWGFDYNKELSPVPQITISGGSYTKTYSRTPDADVAGATYPYAWQEEGQSTHWYTSTDVPEIGDMLYDDPNSPTFSYPIIRASDGNSEADIWIPKRWHYILVEGMKYRMYGNMGVNFETARTNSRAFYDSEKIKAIQNIVDRGQLADTAYFPDLNFLNY